MRARLLRGRGLVLGLVVGMCGAAGIGRVTAQDATSAPRVRARDLGIAVGRYPTGRYNAITDVDGVLVGHSTIVRGSGPLVVGQGPVRSGVTAVLPRQDIWFNGVFAATHTLNGDGEMTGVHWIRDLETLTHPILITSTTSVGAVHDAALAYITERKPQRTWGFLPVVAETWDGRLNDIQGRHVRREHVFEALDGARGGAVPEGNVGGGTGMVCYGFKGGIGTASRRLPPDEGGYTIGVLLQANFGSREQLTVDGVPVGREIRDVLPSFPRGDDVDPDHEGSVIVVVATDAPLSSRQLERLARRVPLGLARTGSTSGNTSGDIFIAFSTANVVAQQHPAKVIDVKLLSTDEMNPLFAATVEATEEAVLNALAAASTMTGVNGNTVYGIPYDRLREVMQRYGRGR
ncbi:MAG: P1 family peptidase [Vicinamibacterales bacterium]